MSIEKKDARGKVIYSRDEAGEDFHKYDEHGREIYSYYFDGSGHFSEFDEHGRETKRVVFDLSVTTYDGNGEWSSTAYEYDENGNLLRERAYTTNYDLYREQIRTNNNEIRAQNGQSSQPQKQLSKARQALVDRVLERLDKGAMPWDNGMKGIAAPRNAVSGKHYRGMNLLNLMLAGKEDPRWITFNQATDANYKVKKGAKGVPIELYKTLDKRTGKDADLAAIKEEIKGMSFEERQAFKRENLQSFARSYYVFNASDVVGIEPYKSPELSPADISARNERIEAVIAGSQAPIFYDGNGRNFYESALDEIHLTARAAFTSDEFFYNTALHEMAHSTGHSSRLKRKMGNGFGSPEYAREELVAEMASVMTAAELGLNHSDRIIENSAEYVRSWAQLIRDNPQTLIDATFDASRATDYICEHERQREQVQEKTQKESLQSSVKEWYARTYPTDELASTLNEKTTFDDVRHTILDGKDIYATLGGSADSVIRERVFHGLADVLGIDYGAVYNDWLDNTEMPETRLERYTRNRKQEAKTQKESGTWAAERDGKPVIIGEWEKHDISEQSQEPTTSKHTKPLMVNFYAGPGSGKTTAALELTAALKKAGYNVEYVSEYAKELVLENKLKDLDNQEHVTDEQYKRFDRLRGSVDVIVTDSPVLLGLVYGEGKISDEYIKQVKGYYNSFDNFNMLVARPKDASFQQEGRVHDAQQSVELDGKIKSMLDNQGVFYGSYKRDDIAKTVERIGQTYSRLYGEQIGKTQKENAANTPPAPAKKPYEFKTNLDNIPNAMKALPNWVAFRTETTDSGKIKKILLSPNKGASSVEYLKWAKSDDSTTWATFDKAVAFAKKYKLDGLAFSMSGSGMTCIDLDKHLDEQGKPSELAQKFIDAAKGTYIEKSVSGRGLHIFYMGSRPNGYQLVNKEKELENYDSARFISMTGNLYDGSARTPTVPSSELNNLLKSNLKPVQQHVAQSKPLGMDDNALIEKIRSSSRGRDFDALWRGELILTKDDGSGDPSRCDYMLCNMLGFFSGGDVAQVERLIKSSGLYRPDKPDKYYAMTARKACDGLTKVYTPPAKSNNTKKNNGKPGGNGSGGR